MKNNYYASPLMNRVRERLARLYGPAAETLLSRFAMLTGRYGIADGPRAPSQNIDQRTSMLIAYADSAQKPPAPSLAIMRQFLEKYVGKAVTHLHILPFCPASSDDGFSVIHFRNVDRPFGKWPDLQALSRSYDLMFDLVLNHVSAKSGWFNDYIAGVAPGRHYFIETDPAGDFSAVTRPRSTALLTPVMTYSGLKNVWTTFSADQIDLNYANPDVLFEMLDIMLFYIDMGARVLRLDAIAYLWKQQGTDCLNRPETHEIIRLMRDLISLTAPDARLLSETNLPHAENVSYFGSGDEAHWVYQFSLPPLLLHALLRGTARYLAAWAEKLPPPPPGCAYLNITGTHDGIGVRPLEGLVPEAEIAGLADHVVKLGGRVSTRRTGQEQNAPYELNSTWFDALGGVAGDTPETHMARFLCAQAILMSFKGIPSVYFNTLLAAPNDHVLAGRTGQNRSLNRGKWQLQNLEATIADQTSATGRSLSAHLRMLKIRAEHPAFHPDGGQKVAAVTDSALGLERISPDGTERILTLANLSSQPLRLERKNMQTHGWENHGTANLLTGHVITRKDILHLEPYAVLWLTLSP